MHFKYISRYYIGKRYVCPSCPKRFAVITRIVKCIPEICGVEITIQYNVCKYTPISQDDTEFIMRLKERLRHEAAIYFRTPIFYCREIPRSISEYQYTQAIKKDKTSPILIRLW